MWKVTASPMNRFLTLFFAGVIVFGGWTLLKAKVLTPQPRHDETAAVSPYQGKILWTAKDSDSQGGGDDPREVFSIGLNRYLGERVSGASMLPLDHLDPAVVSRTDDAAHVSATVAGVHYHGKLKWTDTGWRLVELSRSN